MRTLRAIGMTLLLLLILVPRSAALEHQDALGLLALAGEDMGRADAARTHEEAEPFLRSALKSYMSLVQSGHHSGYIYYNIGNCNLRLHHVGEAVYWYRMAERWIPEDSRLRANLRFARTQVRSRFPTPPASELLRTLFFFHFLIPFNARWIAFLVLWNGLWMWPVVRWFAPALKRLWPVMPALVVGAVVFGLSAAWDIHREKFVEECVVVREETVRKGAALTYDPAFSEPVSPGVEARILDRRRDYVEVRFTNGGVGWLPSGDVRIISE